MRSISHTRHINLLLGTLSLLPMMLSRRRYIVSVIATLIVVSCAVSLQDGYSRLRHGHRLDGKMIDSFGDYSLLDCVEACLSRKRCQSVSYHGGAKLCEINYVVKSKAPDFYLESSGWIYSERNDWDMAITGSCALSNCGKNQTCRPLPTAKHECVLSDCGIPYIRGADMHSVDRWDGIAIGRELHLKCLNHYKQIGSGRLSCSTDGRWKQDMICVECLTDEDPKGLKYSGTQNVTNNGDMCQRWDSQFPHVHRFDELADQRNYCRNPDDIDAPWCYTVNQKIRWRYCSIPKC